MHGTSGFLIQFIRLAGPYWNSENKAKIRSLTVSLIILTILQIVLAVVITQWTAALFDALEQRSMSGLLTQIGLLLLIFVGSMAVTSTHLTVKRRLQIDWRSWLTERVNSKWMSQGNAGAR